MIDRERFPPWRLRRELRRKLGAAAQAVERLEQRYGALRETLRCLEEDLERLDDPAWPAQVVEQYAGVAAAIPEAIRTMSVVAAHLTTLDTARPPRQSPHQETP